MRNLFKGGIVAASLAITSLGSSASAAVVPVGDQCGDNNGAKYISLTQDGSEVSPTLCEGGNSTGGPNSPIGMLGWISGAETQGNSPLGNSNEGDGSLGLSILGSMWTITNPNMFPMLGISVKQGNGYAFYELDLTKSLTGMFYTGNNASPTGNDFSHINAWRMGDPTTPPPVNEVPLPAAGWMLMAGLGGLAAARRRRRAA